MSDEFALLLCIVMFFVAQHEQGYHFFWGNNEDYEHSEVHYPYWITWMVLGGFFCVIGVYLMANMLLKP